MSTSRTPDITEIINATICVSELNRTSLVGAGDNLLQPNIQYHPGTVPVHDFRNGILTMMNILIPDPEAANEEGAELGPVARNAIQKTVRSMILHPYVAANFVELLDLDKHTLQAASCVLAIAIEFPLVDPTMGDVKSGKIHVRTRTVEEKELFIISKREPITHILEAGKKVYVPFVRERVDFARRILGPQTKK